MSSEQERLADELYDWDGWPFDLSHTEAQALAAAILDSDVIRERDRGSAAQGWGEGYTAGQVDRGRGRISSDNPYEAAR